jgi:hypothetical protein
MCKCSVRFALGDWPWNYIKRLLNSGSCKNSLILKVRVQFFMLNDIVEYVSFNIMIDLLIWWLVCPSRRWFEQVVACVSFKVVICTCGGLYVLQGGDLNKLWRVCPSKWWPVHVVACMSFKAVIWTSCGVCVLQSGDLYMWWLVCPSRRWSEQVVACVSLKVVTCTCGGAYVLQGGDLNKLWRVSLKVVTCTCGGVCPWRRRFVHVVSCVSMKALICRFTWYILGSFLFLFFTLQRVLRLHVLEKKVPEHLKWIGVFLLVCILYVTLLTKTHCSRDKHLCWCNNICYHRRQEVISDKNNPSINSVPLY